MMRIRMLLILSSNVRFFRKLAIKKSQINCGFCFFNFANIRCAFKETTKMHPTNYALSGRVRNSNKSSRRIYFLIPLS